jgi:hypothetical protein
MMALLSASIVGYAFDILEPPNCKKNKTTQQLSILHTASEKGCSQSRQRRWIVILAESECRNSWRKRMGAVPNSWLIF